MSNKEIYLKTLKFSLYRLLWDVLAFLVFGGLLTLGFVIGDKTGDHGIAGLLIAGIIGIAGLVVFLRFISYTYKAGQIAMMTKAVTEGSLPENVVAEGKKWEHNCKYYIVCCPDTGFLPLRLLPRLGIFPQYGQFRQGNL